VCVCVCTYTQSTLALALAPRFCFLVSPQDSIAQFVKQIKNLTTRKRKEERAETDAETKEEGAEEGAETEAESGDQPAPQHKSRRARCQAGTPRCTGQFECRICLYICLHMFIRIWHKPHLYDICPHMNTHAYATIPYNV
jgi:hypothetical protein